MACSPQSVLSITFSGLLLDGLGWRRGVEGVNDDGTHDKRRSRPGRRRDGFAWRRAMCACVRQRHRCRQGDRRAGGGRAGGGWEGRVVVVEEGNEKGISWMKLEALAAEGPLRQLMREPEACQKGSISLPHERAQMPRDASR